MITIFEMIWRFFVDLFVSSRITGELTVTGTDEIIIDLPHRPEYVRVEFGDECAPCNPGTDDTVGWDAKKICCKHHCETKCKCCCKGKRWVLVVSWKVAGVRKIVWEVCS